MATATPDAVLSRVDIPEHEQKEIIELYRNAVLSGTTAQLISPAGESRKLPAAVYRLLVDILRDLSEGCSVAILQERKGLTTVQASKMLGVSRQFFVNLLDKGEIPHHMVGTHRRVLIKDVMAYKQTRDKARKAVLKEMVREATEDGSYDAIPDDDFSG
jgi:excisionase family DNA binding protein